MTCNDNHVATLADRIVNDGQAFRLEFDCDRQLLSDPHLGVKLLARLLRTCCQICRSSRKLVGPTTYICCPAFVKPTCVVVALGVLHGYLHRPDSYMR